MSRHDPQPWQADAEPTRLRDAMLLVALTALPLAVAARTLRSSHDLVIKSIVIGAALGVPAVIFASTLLGRLLFSPDDRRRSDLFLIVYMGLTFLSVFAIVTVFMFDKPMAAMLGIALFGFLANLSRWI
jgi:dipeptide/tripeptide permease